MSDPTLSAEQREALADACDAGIGYGDTWIRFLRNGNETMLLPVVARMVAEAKAEALQKAEDADAGYHDAPREIRKMLRDRTDWIGGAQ